MTGNEPPQGGGANFAERDRRVREHGHSTAAIRQRLGAGPRASYLRDWIYGGIDGAITTFAIVAGATGGNLSVRVIIILGLANVVADGFSMAAGNYTSTKAENDEHRRLRRVEERHVDLVPEGEREEIRAIYRSKGFTGDDLERAVAVITADRRRWIDTMLTEEYGLPLVVRSPLLAALSTFTAFLVCGMVPLLPYLFGATAGLPLALAATAVVFFAIGSIRSHWTVGSWWRAGLETLGIGLSAALIAYAIGHGLKSFA